MSLTRIFNSSDFMLPSNNEPLRTVVETTNEAVIVAWYLKPGQRIPPHTHPRGQDTWTILEGSGDYFLDHNGTVMPIKAGDVVVARTNDVHGAFNTGNEPLAFISVVSPADAGYSLLELAVEN